MPQSRPEIPLRLTPEALAEWKTYPHTQEVFRCLREVREDYRLQLAGGEAYHPASVERTAMETARMLGIIYGLTVLLEIEVAPEPPVNTTGY